MDARQVDPRDTTSEITSPTYRVYFSAVDGASDEYELTRAEDVHEVLRWAEANAGGRTFTAHVVVDKVLVRLSGEGSTP